MGVRNEWKLFIPSVDIPFFVGLGILSIVGIVNYNLNLQRACYIILGNKKSDCEMLGNENNNITQALEGDAQYINNLILLVSQCTESIITMLISLLIGPWTDKFGRKRGLVLTWTGFMLTYSFGLVYTHFEFSPWYTLLGGLPMMVCGGFFSYVSVASTFLTDITNSENRGIRIASFNAFGSLGSIVGMFGSAPLLAATSYFQVNVITTSFLLICWFFIIFVIKESLPEVQTKGVISGFFDLSSPKEMFKTTFKKRTGANRSKILLMTCIGALWSFIFFGEMNLRTLFLRKKFGWVMAKYSIFNGIDNFVAMLGTVFGTLFFINLLKLRESIACLVSIVLTMVGTTVLGLATKDWQVYLVPLIRCTDGAQTALVTTITSKLVSQDEVGKLLSGINGIRFLVSLFASPVYTSVYNATLNIHPGIYSFLSTFVAFVISILLVCIIVLENRHSQTDEDSEPKKSIRDRMSQKLSIKSVVDLSNEVALNNERKASLIM